MVNRVACSFIGDSRYRELNVQLAKENGDLKNKLNAATNEVAEQQEIILTKDVQINKLQKQLHALEIIKYKYEQIVRVVDEDYDNVDEKHGQLLPLPPSSESTKSAPERETQPLPLPLHAPSDSMKEVQLKRSELPSLPNHSNSIRVSTKEEITRIETNMDASQLEAINESERENEVEEKGDETFNAKNDSLEPADVTSVPSLKPEVILHTPSIWHLNETPTKVQPLLESNVISPFFQMRTGDMLQSTPVQDKKVRKKGKTTKSQENTYNLRKRTRKL